MSYLKHFLGAHEEERRRHFKDYNYEIAERLKIAYLYCKKEVKLEDNTNMLVDVKTVRIPKNTVVILCPYMRSDIGAVVGVGEDINLPISSERAIDKVLFCVSCDGVFNRGDLMGAIMLIPVDEVNGG